MCPVVSCWALVAPVLASTQISAEAKLEARCVQLEQVDEGTSLWDEVSSFRSIQESWSSTPIRKEKTFRLVAHLILLFCAICKWTVSLKLVLLFPANFLLIKIMYLSK